MPLHLLLSRSLKRAALQRWSTTKAQKKCPMSSRSNCSLLYQCVHKNGTCPAQLFKLLLSWSEKVDRKESRRVHYGRAMSNAGYSSKASTSEVHLSQSVKQLMHKINSKFTSPHIIIGRPSRLIELALLVLVRIGVLRVVISLATLLTPKYLIRMPTDIVLTMLTGSRLRAVSAIVRHIFLLVIVHETIMLLYWR